MRSRGRCGRVPRRRARRRAAMCRIGDALGVPRTTGVGETEFRGERGAELGGGARPCRATRSNCLAGADRSAELHGEGRAVDGLDGRAHAVEPSGDGDAESCSAPRAARACGRSRWCRAPARRARRARCRRSRGAQRASASAALRDQHEGRVEDVLARRAGVHAIARRHRRSPRPVRAAARRAGRPAPRRDLAPASRAAAIERAGVERQRRWQRRSSSSTRAPRANQPAFDLDERREHRVVGGRRCRGAERFEQSPVVIAIGLRIEVEEDGLAVALQPDVETVARFAVGRAR